MTSMIGDAPPPGDGADARVGNEPSGSGRGAGTGSDSGRIPWWVWPNILSLDAPILAVLWTWLFAACDRLHFGAGLYAVVFGVVWCVYAGDRLVDVWRTAGGSGRADTLRLAFHRRHWWKLLPVLLLVAALTAWGILFRMPLILVKPAAFSSILVLLYFAQNLGRVNRALLVATTALTAVILVAAVSLVPLHPVFKGLYAALCFSLVALSFRGDGRIRFGILPKEVLCGLAFAIGVGLPTYVYSARGWLDMFSSVPVWTFAGLCTLNCIGIAIAEWENDRGSDEAALPQQLPGIGRFFIPLLAGVGIIAVRGWVAGSGFADRSWPILGAIICALILLGTLHVLRERMTPVAYRVLADAALLTPLIFLPVALARG